MIAIIDYDLGNLSSVQRAFEHLGASVVTTNDPERIHRADRLVLPGVGAFGEGMKNLHQKGLTSVIQEEARAGKPLLGICLGMQLLLSSSEELGQHEGLNLIKGEVLRFTKFSSFDVSYKVPHVGWNALKIHSHTPQAWKGSLLQGLKEGDACYFVHSFVVTPRLPETILGTTIYGGLSYCSVIQKNRIWGCQFHPEKSGPTGLRILENFLSL